MKYHHHLKSLHYFSVTAQHLSIKDAAESLSITQAAISQQIRSLEEALGVDLFQRHHRALSLTPEGEKLLPHLTTAFDAIDRGTREIVTDNAPNTITLSVFASFASRWLIPRLGHFYQQNPDINIKLSMSDKYETFKDGIDLAIRFSNGEPEDIKSLFLMKDYIYPACHPMYLQEHNIRTIQDLKIQRLLEDTKTSLSWDYWLAKKSAAKQLGTPSNSLNRVKYDGSHYVIDSALSAQGVAMARHSLVADAIHQNQLVKLFDGAVELDSQYYLCAPQHYFQYPKIKRFTQWLTEEISTFCTQNPV